VPDPAISVIIATHNRCTSCMAAVESALAQELAPFEVIVCDDGSTDATRATLEADPRVRYVRLEPASGGPAAPRNRGIREARGDWVAFLDDDDTWRPGKLASQAAAFDDADVVAGDAERSSGGRYFGKPTWHPGRQDLLDDNPVITSTAVARRALLLDAGGFPAQPWLSGIEDYALWLALSDRGARFTILGEVLADYTDDPGHRLSDRERRVQSGLTRLALQRWGKRPWSFELFRAAGNQAVRSARIALSR
jgi:glycosyltransferase involved in cell wall biosynthesis